MDRSTFDEGAKRSADDRQRRRRLAFDLFFGVTVPLGHMTFERDLFLSADEDGTGFYGVEVLPVYVFCGAAIAVLITWLTTRRYALVLVGPLLVSAFGLLLLAILWTFLGLGKIASGDPTGIFGVLAPLTIAVFLRSAIEADRAVRRTTSWPVLASVGVVTAAAMVALPFAAVRGGGERAERRRGVVRRRPRHERGGGHRAGATQRLRAPSALRERRTREPDRGGAGPRAPSSAPVDRTAGVRHWRGIGRLVSRQAPRRRTANERSTAAATTRASATSVDSSPGSSACAPSLFASFGRG